MCHLSSDSMFTNRALRTCSTLHFRFLSGNCLELNLIDFGCECNTMNLFDMSQLCQWNVFMSCLFHFTVLFAPPTNVAMSFSDSEAVFFQRCREIGFDDDVVTNMKAKQLTTMSRFAFACNYSPAGVDESPLVALAKEIYGKDPSTIEMSSILHGSVASSFTSAFREKPTVAARCPHGLSVWHIGRG